MEDTIITKAVSERYARAVSTGEEMCCPTGYNHEELRAFIPDAVLKVSYGCGTPVGLSTAKAGETVLDIGSGGGIDCFEAARRVGPTGHIIGLDMTDEMLAFARNYAPEVAKNLGYAKSNVDFRKGQAEAMPVDDDSVDLIISNCVINLAPDKSKVFQEMYRVIRLGGRFTISDIVADQPVPNYLRQDKDKWGDCLSGALPIHDYWDGLRKAGFLGLHLVKLNPWKVIDGIHFLSVTLTGYKLPKGSSDRDVSFATLAGPFSRVTDEYGQSYIRGIPQPIDHKTIALLQTAPYQEVFILSDTPMALTSKDSRWKALLPQDAPCVWEGDYAMLTGPFLEVSDDDDHLFHSGIPQEICSKTFKVLQHDSYRRCFGIIRRAETPRSGGASFCEPNGSCC